MKSPLSVDPREFLHHASIGVGASLALPNLFLNKTFGETPLKDGDVRLIQSKEHHQNWLECVKSRKLPICEIAIGRRSATVCHLGSIAFHTGRKIQWDPANEVVVGDAGPAQLTTKEYRAPWKLPRV